MSYRSSILGAAFLVGIFSNFSQIAALRLLIGNFYGTELHLGVFLGVWLGGVALGAALAAFFRPGPGFCLGFLALSGPLVLYFLWILIDWFPELHGGFLPFIPVMVFMLVMTVPFSVPIGAFIPAVMNTVEQLPDPGKLPFSGESGSSAGSPPPPPFEKGRPEERPPGAGRPPSHPCEKGRPEERPPGAGCPPSHPCEMPAVFSVESAGGFFGGVLFSLVLGGKVPSIIILLGLPILPLMGLFLIGTKRVAAGLIAVFWGISFLFFGSSLEVSFQERFWKHFHPGFKRELSVETPYQHIQKGNYQEELSLYIDGNFVQSWPDSIRAEEKVHFFVSALASPGNILLIGGVPPDQINEFMKYPSLEVSILELDSELINVLRVENSRVKWINRDPRAFLRETSEKYDGILVIPSDPTTLLSNRLFTQEAFSDMKNALTVKGVLSVSVSGAENYLGTHMEKVLLSLHRTLKSVFTDVFAVPGDPIVFWSSHSNGVLIRAPEKLRERFEGRQISTVSFQPFTFFNLLLPFRVEEIANWLRRNVEVELNRDSHPTAFSRQIRLWDIFSGSQVGNWLGRLETFTFPRTVAGICVCLAGTILAFWIIVPGAGKVGTYGISAGISGFVGLLMELVLVLLYQNRHGAMFQMAALFFGIYMLGLAGGSMVGSSFPRESEDARALPMIKILQIGVVIAFLIFLEKVAIHGAGFIGGGIFLIALLAGWELVLLDRNLRGLRVLPVSSSGLLFWSDNSGALLAAICAGPWFLPVMGLNGATELAAILLCGNLLLLLLFAGRKTGGVLLQLKEN